MNETVIGPGVSWPESSGAGDRRRLAARTSLALIALTLLVSVVSLGIGAADASFWHSLVTVARGGELNALERVVLFDIRLPRLAMGLLVGAALAVSGAVMQGLFRNPLADPGLVGVGAGAGLGAIIAIVLGASLPAAVSLAFGHYIVPVAAFLGGWVATIVLYQVSTSHGRTSVAMMLLAGIALGALAAALSGILVYLANDAQLRDLTFWGLGSLAGATWGKLMAAAPLILVAMAAAPFLARSLNALALGEAAAGHLGIPIQRMKMLAVVVVALATGAAVAVSGGIGFIGIVVPHLLRISVGPDHRYLLLNSALLGASLLVLADTISRTIIAPAELPIGILTAVIGGPVFIWILLRNRGLLNL